MAKIFLKHIVAKNKSDLSTFIKKKNINSYEELVEYCKRRNFIPISLEEYMTFTGNAKEDILEKEQKVSNENKNKESISSNRKTSTAQKKRRGRPRSKKVASP